MKKKSILVLCCKDYGWDISACLSCCNEATRRPEGPMLASPTATVQLCKERKNTWGPLWDRRVPAPVHQITTLGTFY